jgi:hypothetical protein
MDDQFCQNMPFYVKPDRTSTAEIPQDWRSDAERIAKLNLFVLIVDQLKTPINYFDSSQLR